MAIEKDNYKDIPYINSIDDLVPLLKEEYIIQDYISVKQRFNELYINIRNIVRGCFHIKECREYPVTIRFYQTDDKTVNMQLRHFLVHLILWQPLCELPDKHIINETYIMPAEETPKVSKFINNKILKVLKASSLQSIIINRSCEYVMNELRSISIDFSNIMGLTFGADDFINMYNKKKYRDIMESNFDDCTQPIEIEEKQAKLESKLISLLVEDVKNPLGIILRADTGMKHKQLFEFMGAIALKPTIMGEVITRPISTSTLIGGLRTPGDYFIDASGGQKSLIMNKKMMGKAGYFGKIVLELTKTLKVSKKVYDCGSHHYVRYHIQNKKYLQKLTGKYYVMDPNDEDLLLLDAETDTHLIGKDIYARSAITCACGQNHVCPTCMGTIMNLNMDIADGFPGFESEEVTKVVNQSILSAKHLLTTKSENITFSPSFYKYFTFSNGDISPILKGDIENIDDYAIIVNTEDISKVEDMDSDSLYNTFISSGKFYVKNLKTDEEEEISIINNKEIYICSETLEMLYDGGGMIKFKDLDEEMSLFEVVIMNNELTKPLYDLMDLLNKASDEESPYQDINECANKFLDILIEANIKASMVAGELIINRLVKSSDNIMVRPNFKKYRMPDYRIYTVKQVLEHNPSITIGLGFENLKRQLLSSELESRTTTSYMDALYKEDIDTEPLRRYQK